MFVFSRALSICVGYLSVFYLYIDRYIDIPITHHPSCLEKVSICLFLNYSDLFPLVLYLLCCLIICCLWAFKFWTTARIYFYNLMFFTNRTTVYSINFCSWKRFRKRWTLYMVLIKFSILEQKAVFFGEFPVITFIIK